MSGDSESSAGDDPSAPGDTGVGYGSVYSGMGQYSPNNDSEPTRLRVDPRIALDAARKERAEALAQKQKQLTDAFSAFGDDYYNDLSSAYTDFQTPLLSSAYEDAKRGVYDGFKAKGLLTQAEVDAGLGDLLTQKTIDTANINTGASGYVQAKKDEVAKKQKALGDALSAMAGGATTLDEINKQTENIKTFDFSKDVEKLRPAASKTALTFFDGFTKIPLGDQPIENVAPVSTSGAAQTGTITPAYTYTGINDPYSGSGTRVVS